MGMLFNVYHIKTKYWNQNELRITNKSCKQKDIVTENATSYICITTSIYHYSLDFILVSLHFSHYLQCSAKYHRPL